MSGLRKQSVCEGTSKEIASSRNPRRGTSGDRGRRREVRFSRFSFHPSPIIRTERRIKNAWRAVQRELDDIPLFPQLARYSSASERLDQIDSANMVYWQRIRDNDAKTWRKFRRRLASLLPADAERFIEYWNSHTAIPGDACYASDTLTIFFNRKDWIMEDISEIQGGAVK